ncbi:transglutaminase family protein [Ramlibacter albus]|uniref:Protein SirB1 N-terminal domain-containing protein n=1 Tax=Ramlibacter albus TaxID=2079448 RepID=A0A923S2Y2_9BURK|nr:transglutaminase family protein [Ramlibacter albus]MBC5765831.1 hypothetical protein [Ramlibacter albus]
MKRRTALASTFAAIVAAPLSTSAAMPRPHGLPAAVSDLLALPEDRIDVGRASLVLAREVYPRLDVERYSSRIDEMVRGARQYMASQPSRNYIDTLIAFNTYMFRHWGMAYDHAADARDKQANYFLNGILDTRKGMCITMPLLYMSVAQRLPLFVRGVTAPLHCFLRYVRLAAPHHNIEVTSGGGVLSDAEYIRRYGVPQRGLESGAYMRTLTMREYLGIVMLQIPLVIYRQGRTQEALAYFEAIHELDPRDVVCLDYLARFWRAEGQMGKSEAYRRKAVELGISYGTERQ